MALDEEGSGYRSYLDRDFPLVPVLQKGCYVRTSDMRKQEVACAWAKLPGIKKDDG